MLSRMIKRGDCFTRRVATTGLLIAAIISGGSYLFRTSSALAGNNVRYVTFVALTQADTKDGKVHRVGMNGSALFDPDTGWVNGGGTLEHFDFGAKGLPKPSLGTAKWKVTRFLKFTACTPPDNCKSPKGTTYGHIVAGVVDLELDLYFDGGRKVTGATLTVICNVGFAGIINKDPATGASLPEGYFLTFKHPDFGVLRFKPLKPIMGVTHIGFMPPHELR